MQCQFYKNLPLPPFISSCSTCDCVFDAGCVSLAGSLLDLDTISSAGSISLCSENKSITKRELNFKETKLVITTYLMKKELHYILTYLSKIYLLKSEDLEI